MFKSLTVPCFRHGQRLMKHTLRYHSDIPEKRCMPTKTIYTLNRETFGGVTVKPMDGNEEIKMTDKALQRLKLIVGSENKTEMLRIAIDLDAQKGLQNKITLTKTMDEDDIIFEKEGIRVVIDGMTLKFIEGSTIDFVEELIGSSFQVISPQAKGGRRSNVPYDIDIDLLTQN
ncbi:hypothetical protein EC973_008232 [Apophysomyces ossiformis]|uniref:Core domain-containing protein n=1 Tax=Apophysomyces ossiformis TaxID=679940 RepID=A0A8H7BU15_9FUNG|nr:hypothetical protein EC973_008232 [Apophysomyces ossiformis]